MKIWIFNNYNMLPKHGALNRAYFLGKQLKRIGHEPVVFVGSHPHNTNLQLITGKEKFIQSEDCDFPWVLVKTCNYEGSKLKRIFSMFQYYTNLMKAVKHYEKPDAIIGSSAHPLAAVAAIRLAKNYCCKGIVEIRDLWPESIVAYDVASRNNPLVWLLYKLEKWIYTKADAIIFTMEGGRDYIIEKGWGKGYGGPIDLGKVYHINNGVDLELFEQNRDADYYIDEDLSNPSIFKVTYMGSIRLVNKVDKLVEVARVLRERRADQIKVLIWGDGDQREVIQEKIDEANLTNIVLKGWVQKDTVPQILEQSDLNVLIMENFPLYRFGISANKLFEYFASGKPVLVSWTSGYSIIDRYQCGVCLEEFTPKKMADEIIRFAEISSEEYNLYCQNAKRAAQEYDFKVLTQKLVKVIENT